jgi:hypothetical protein
MSETQRGRLAFGLGAAAVTWALLLVAGAFALPAYQGGSCEMTPGGAPNCGPAASQTLVAVNGWWVVELLLGVALVAGITLVALHVRCSTGGTFPTVVATVAITALAVFSLATGFSIGIFVLPVALLLFASARLTPRGSAPPGP